MKDKVRCFFIFLFFLFADKHYRNMGFQMRKLSNFIVHKRVSREAMKIEEGRSNSIPK